MQLFAKLLRFRRVHLTIFSNFALSLHNFRNFNIRLEALYHYMWKHRMFGTSVPASSGKRVEIVCPGVHNNDAGPDFSAAIIRHDGEEWAGNVEIHVKASDWERHGHHADPAYDTVILHVVGVDDDRVRRTDGSEILQACVAPPAEFYERYAMLTENMDSPTCLPWLSSIPALNKTDWINSLGVERIQEKASYMKSILESNNGDWQQTIFIVLARAFGFGLNGVPFELLAKSLPLNFVMRHRDNPMQIEAMVFGQAWMLKPDVYQYDEYYMALCREYAFLQKKYNLSPIKSELWKYSRTRPGNFPHRRIAVLSSMLADGMQLYSRLVEAAGDYDILMESLEFSASDYWHGHSRFGEVQSAVPLPVTLSRSSKEIILINVMAPFYFAYGSIAGNPDIAEKGLDLLHEIGAEKNTIISLWSRHGLKAACAFESQAFIHLRRNYCDRSRCMDCRFGHYLLRSAMKYATYE